MGSKHTTVWNVVDILDAYNYLRNDGMTKVTAKTLFDYYPVKSVATIGKVIDIYEPLKFTKTKVKPSNGYSDKLIKMVELYNMCSAAPKYLKAWRSMETLEDPNSVKSVAHELSKKPNAWSEQQYCSIHKVFSYMRDGKINDGVNNQKLHDVATAYFYIVGISNKKHNFNPSAKRTVNTNIDYDKIWEDCLIYNDFEVAEINNCGRSTVTRIRHIYKAIRDNTPISGSFINSTNIIDAAKNYFNGNNNATNTTTTPTICNSALPVELIELLNIENELKQLKVKENDLLLKKDTLITALNTLVNN